MGKIWRYYQDSQTESVEHVAVVCRNRSDFKDTMTHNLIGGEFRNMGTSYEHENRIYRSIVTQCDVRGRRFDFSYISEQGMFNVEYAEIMSMLGDGSCAKFMGFIKYNAWNKQKYNWYRKKWRCHGV